MNTSIAYNIGSDIAQSIIDNTSGPDIVEALQDAWVDDIGQILEECKTNYMSYSPFEITAKDFNASDDPDSVWNAFDNGFSDKIALNMDYLKALAMDTVQDLIKEEQETMYENEHDTFDELLDSANDEITIGGMVFLPSQVLKQCDPIAYNESYLCFLNDFESEEMERLNDVKEKIEHS